MSNVLTKPLFSEKFGLGIKGEGFGYWIIFIIFHSLTMMIVNARKIPITPKSSS